MGSRGVVSGPRQVERGGVPRTRLVHKRTCTKGELHIEVRRLVDGEVSCLLADCVATPSRSLFLMLPFMTEDVEVGHGQLAGQDNQAYSACPS